MEEFNKLEPILDDSKVYGREHTVVGFRGSINEWRSDKSGWGTRAKDLLSFKDRKLESDKHVKGEILIYSGTRTSGYVDWKTLYRNTKGVYFKNTADLITLKRHHCLIT